MININKQGTNGLKQFYLSAISSSLAEVLSLENAGYLAKVLVAKLDEEALKEFLESPIFVIDAEDNVLIDNAFIKKQLMKQGAYELLSIMDKLKIVICNCNNIAVKGLDIILLAGNSVRVISADENDTKKREVFLAKGNKIIHSCNMNYTFCSNNSIKNLLHSDIEVIKNTKILDMSVTSEIVCPIKQWSANLNVQSVALADGKVMRVFNPVDNILKLENSNDK